MSSLVQNLDKVEVSMYTKVILTQSKFCQCVSCICATKIVPNRYNTVLFWMQSAQAAEKHPPPIDTIESVHINRHSAFEKVKLDAKDTTPNFDRVNSVSDLNSTDKTKFTTEIVQVTTVSHRCRRWWNPILIRSFLLVSDNVAIVPTFYAVFNPNNFESNPTVFVGNICTQLSF